MCRIATATTRARGRRTTTVTILHFPLETKTSANFSTLVSACQRLTSLSEARVFQICAHWALRTCCLGRVVIGSINGSAWKWSIRMLRSNVCPSSLGWLGWPKIAWKCVQSYLHHLFYNRTIYIHLYSFETCSVESIEGKMWVGLGEYPSSLFPTIPPYVLHNAYVAGAFPKLHTCSIWNVSPTQSEDSWKVLKFEKTN